MFRYSEYYSYSQRGPGTKPPHSLHTLWHTVASSPLGDYDDYDDHDDDDDDADHYDEDEGHDSLNELLYGLEVSQESYKIAIWLWCLYIWGLLS